MNISWITMEQMDNRERDSVGSSRIRGRWLWQNWSKLFPEDSAEQMVIGKKYDVIFFQKVYWEDMIRNFDGVKIFDICDPDWLEGRQTMEYIRMCHACTTSTLALKEYIEKFVDIPVYFIPDRVDTNELKSRGKHIGKARKICWIGYVHNQHYIYPTLEFLADKGLELTIVSDQAYRPPTGFDFIKINNFTYTYPEVNERIKACDLYLVPETKDERGKFKSNNKAINAMALGVPCVYVPEDLQRLVEEDARNEQMQKDLEEVKNKYDILMSVRELKEIINKCGK